MISSQGISQDGLFTLQLKPGKYQLRDLRFDNVPFGAGLILLQRDCLAGILFLHKSLVVFRPERARSQDVIGIANEGDTDGRGE
jgi:hypothetical protein